jgi:hypothetical protein
LRVSRSNTTSIFRVKKQRNFVAIDKSFLSDPSLSCKAKGLLAFFLSKPDDWEFRLSEIRRNFKDGKESIRRGIEELQKAGYVKKVKLRGTKGKFDGVRYLIYETPYLSEVHPQTDFPASGKPKADNPSAENPSLLNNDITKDTSYRAGTSEDISKWGKNDFIKRTASLIKERLEIEDNYKLAAALIGDSDRQIDWYFPMWLVEYFTEAINRADDKKKYLFSLLKKPELWKLFMSFLESESFNGRGL